MSSGKPNLIGCAPRLRRGSKENPSHGIRKRPSERAGGFLPSAAETMPLRIRRSRLAQLDQNGIWLTIAEDSVSGADGVLERINAAIFMLAEQPAAGRERSELK